MTIRQKIWDISMIQFDQTIGVILLATGILGLNAGVLGSFLVLQRKSLFGDSIAHATLPGLTGIFFCTLSKNPWILLCGGTISALIAAMVINQLEKHTTLKKETALGIVLATSFGLGTMILSKIQTIPDAHQAGLTKYLLGNASTLLHIDLWMITYITVISGLLIYLILKPYKIMLFDPEYATTCNIANGMITFSMLLLTTLTIVIGLQTVGVILISALLIAPACAARQWTNNFGTMIIIAALFGMLATTIGTLISSATAHLPTGPTIVIVASSITLLSILFAPNGIIITWWRHRQQIKRMNAMSMLSNFLLFNEGLQNPYHAHDLAALQALGKKGTNDLIKYLAKKGYIESRQKNFWCLTKYGLHWLQQQEKTKHL